MDFSKIKLEELINNLHMSGEQVNFLMSATQDDILDEFISNNRKIKELGGNINDLQNQLFQANFYGVALLDQHAQRDGFFENLSEASNSTDLASAVAWLEMAVKIKATGGYMSDEGKAAVKNIFAILSENDKSTLQWFSDGMKENIPELGNAANMSAGEILAVIKNFLL